MIQQVPVCAEIHDCFHMVGEDRHAHASFGVPDTNQGTTGAGKVCSMQREDLFHGMSVFQCLRVGWGLAIK